MKKLIIFPLAVAVMAFMLLTSGCKKSTSTPSTWSWKGTNYSSSSSTVSTSTAAGYGTSNTITVQDGSNTLQVIFNGPLPTVSAIDTVEPWGGSTNSNEVTLSLGTGNGATYQSTGGNGFNSTINVNVSGGVITVSSPANNPVELLNVLTNSASDSAGVSFSLVH